MKVAVVGSIIVDLVARAERAPNPRETVTGTSLSIVPGGKGANQAVACARMGCSVELFGCVGTDAFADIALASLGRAGVAAGGILRSAASRTGIAFIVIDAASENTILVLRGANDDLPMSHLEAVAGRIAAADALLVQLEMPLPIVGRAMEIARRAGVPVLLDPAPALQIPDRFIAMADFITPNEQETRTLTGIDPATTGAALEAAAALHRRGARNVVVKRGALGCVASAGGDRAVIAGHEVRAVDTVGAGDCFAGALMSRWLETRDFFTACRFANAASALKVQRASAQSGIPSRGEVEGFLAALGG
jgi:ribokinase